MNILHIASKEIKVSFRDKRTFIFMLAFPIVFMLIFTAALSNAFDSEVTVGKIEVLYTDQANTPISQYFTAFIKEARKENVYFKKADTEAAGKTDVKENHADAYVSVENNGFTVYTNDRSGINGTIVEGMLTAVTNQYKAGAAAVKAHAAPADGQVKNDYIQQTSLNKAKEPKAKDFYAISMTTMIALYAAIFASTLFRGERIRHTADRLFAAPVRRSDIFLGKTLGILVSNFLTILVVVAFSKFILKANWGSHIGIVLLILATEVLLAVSFGLSLSYMTKKPESARVITVIIVQVMAIIGGAYYKYDGGGISALSPLTWINRAINKIIYTNDLSAAWPALGLNLTLAALFLLIAVITFQRREGI
ncbi:ABC transporter permease [Bacillus sp. YC2]|uniref:ABC transporter permease n=1 Tax=Bacillus sp. YC2 TaxID=2861287 RepID=UPI001CA67352|nr:ABC transporter permease [Bacillus sp. YC2]MBY8911377.1 ABC transporter permease [Bacillus sp. YC2]